MPTPEYPQSRTVDAEESLAGVSFADPYRWLEEDSDEVRRWQEQQSQLASRWVRQQPHFDDVKASVAHFSSARSMAAPRSKNGRWFRIDLPKGSKQAIAVVSDSPAGEGRVLFDPTHDNRDNPPFLSWISPSPNGRVLALGVCADGSENNTIRLIDVESGKALPNPPTQTLMDAWAGGAHWLADSSGFYFTALAGSAQEFDLRVFRHDMGDDFVAGGGTTQVDVPIPRELAGYPFVLPDASGRWVIVMCGPVNAHPFAVLDLHAGSQAWRPFVTNVQATVCGHIVGDRYIAVTDVDAPRSRIVAIPLDSPTPNDPSTWEEIVPQSDAVISGIRPVGDKLYVMETVDAYARVRIFTVDGQLVGEVPLPGRGVISLLHVPGIDKSLPLVNSSMPVEQAGFIFGYSSLMSSWGMYLHRPGAAQLETLQAPDVTLEGAVIEDHWAASSDGTRIPYHIVRLESATADQARPTLMYGYGGFRWPLMPEFPGAMAAFVAAGGLFIHCHLRGGGEFGRDWWDGGRMRNKQNCYHDLYAIAEALIWRNVTRPDLLGVTGMSNGGLMAAVALAQRPDLWRVAVPRVPIVDLIGGCRAPYGRWAIAMDYGNPDDAEEVRRIAEFSPYHLIKNDVVYPAVYIQAGDSDPRCPPWHSRKLAARLQAAQAGDAPVLLHVWKNAGHGFATSKEAQIEENSEWLAFVMARLGMGPGPKRSISAADRT